jgi:hypothetical protein
MNVNSVAEGFRFDFDEIWETATSVEILRGDTAYRIEVLRDLKNPNPQFSVHYFSRSGGLWRAAYFGSIHAHTAEGALSQGLGFIRKTLVE